MDVPLFKGEHNENTTNVASSCHCNPHRCLDISICISFECGMGMQRRHLRFTSVLFVLQQQREHQAASCTCTHLLQFWVRKHCLLQLARHRCWKRECLLLNRCCLQWPLAGNMAIGFQRVSTLLVSGLLAATGRGDDDKSGSE